MAAGHQAGSAYVTIAPGFEGFQAQVGAVMSAAGTSGAEDFAQSWESSARPRLAAALESLPDAQIGADATEADAALADIRAELESLSSARVGVDLDAAQAQTRLDELMASIQHLDAEHPEVTAKADVGKALAELQALAIECDVLDRKTPEVNAKADTGGAVTSLAALAAAADGAALSGMAVGTTYAAALAALIPVAAAAAAAIAGVAQAGAGLAAGGAVMALGLAPVLKAAQAKEAATSSGGGGGGGDAGAAQARADAIEAANKRIADAERGVADAREAAARSAQSAAERVQEAQRGIAEATESAQQANADAAARVQDAQAAVADAVQSAADANEQAAARVKDAQAAVADAHEAAAEGVRRAQEQQARAVEAAERANTAAAKRVADAQRAAAQQRVAAARQVAQAEAQQRAAEQALTAAQAGVVAAQQRVTDARIDAKRAIDDLNAAIRGGSLDERAAEQQLREAEQAMRTLGSTALEVAQAQHDFADAQRAAALSGSTEDALAAQAAKEHLDAVQAAVGGTKEQRDAAQLAYDQAAFRLEEVRKRNADLKATKADADRAGVEGSEQVKAAEQGVADAKAKVVDAQQRVATTATATRDAQTSAAQSIADADARIADARAAQVQTQRDGMARVADAARAVATAQESGAKRVQAAESALAKARQDATRTATDGAQSIARAEAAVAKARQDAARTAVDGERSIAAARESYAKARQAQDQAAEDGAKRVADAQRRVADAHEALERAQRKAATAGAAAAGGANAYEQALAKLTPEGRSFLALVEQMKGGLDTLSRTAQRTMLPGFERALRSLAPAFGPVNTLVGRLGTTLGKLAEDGARQLRGPFWTSFGKLLADQLPVWLDKGARIMGNFATVLAGAFRGMMPAGNDFLDMLLKWSQGLANNSKTLDSNPGFQKFLAYCRENLPRVAKLIGDLTAAAAKVITALAPFGPQLLAVADGIAKWIANADESHVRAGVLGLGGLTGALKAAVTAANVFKGAMELADKAKQFKDAVDQMATVGKLTQLFKNAAGALRTVGMAMLTPPLGFVVAGAAVVAGLVALYQHCQPFHDAVDALGRKVRDVAIAVAKWFGDMKDKTVGKITEIVAWIRKNWRDVLLGLIATTPMGAVVKAVVKHWDDIRRKFSDGVEAVKRFLGKAWAVARWLGDGFGNIGRWVGDKFNDVKAAAGRGVEAVRRGIADAVSGWGRIFDALDIGGRLGGAFETARDRVVGALKNVNQWVDWAMGPIKSLTDKLGSIHLPGFASGGLVTVEGYASGGMIPGQPPRDGRDNLPGIVASSTGSRPIRVMSGEFIQPVPSVAYYGAEVMEALRRRLIPRQVLTGLVSGGAPAPLMPRASFATGGLATASTSGYATAVTGAAQARAGALVAVLDPGSQAALLKAADLAHQPVHVTLDGRELFAATRSAAARYAHR